MGEERGGKERRKSPTKRTISLSALVCRYFSRFSSISSVSRSFAMLSFASGAFFFRPKRGMALSTNSQ
jgi:hypothetical protein